MITPFGWPRTANHRSSRRRPFIKRNRGRNQQLGQTPSMRPEKLEPRAMLAISVVEGGPLSNYALIASDKASDVYIRQTVDDQIQVANNSSFLGDPAASDPDYEYEVPFNAPDILYVTNGASGSGPGLMYAGDNTGSNWQTDGQLATTVGFTLDTRSTLINPPVYALDSGFNRIPRTYPPGQSPPTPLLPHEAFVINRAVTGRVSYDGAAWDFSIEPSTNIPEFRLRPGSNPNPAASPVSRAGSLDLFREPRGRLNILWTSPVATVPTNNSAAVIEPPRLEQITYYVDSRPTSEFRLLPSTLPTAEPAQPSASYTFTIPGSVFTGGTLGGIIPGSFGGTASIDGTPVRFQDDFTTSSRAGEGGPLYFNGVQAFTVNGVDGFVTVSGSYRVVGTTVTVDLRFSGPSNLLNANGNRYGTSSPLGPSTVDNVGYLAYVQDPNPNSFTVFAGHDLTSQLEVQYATSDSTINIDSRVIVGTPGSASNIDDVSLAATNVNIEALVASQDAVRVTTETLLVDAAVGAPVRFDLAIRNDPGNDLRGGPQRGRLQLSPSGSLSGLVSPSLASVSTPTGTINVIATQADVYAEGIVWGTKQDWLMQSPRGGAPLAPYEFTTVSPASGAATGLIRGDTVSIVLGNDAPTPLDGSIAYNTVDLDTRVDSLRIKAATQQLTTPTPSNPSASGPFPYELSVREVDDISIDAVAASGLPLSIQSSGSMRFTSALATASDVSLRALSPGDTPSRLSVSAPLSTTKGKIRLVGDGISLNNSVTVTGADRDEFRDDIWITAAGGDLSTSGLVSAVNRIKIEQRNPLGPTTTPYSNNSPLPLPDLSTRTQVINVADDFVFDNLDVGVDLTHPFVGDLRITLISPDGLRFRLADRNGGGGDNFTGTIFDTEAAQAISQGTAPFTGRFRPIDSLAPLYRTSSLGTWRLEVVDAAGGDTGSLTNFTLLFQTLQPQAARVFGPARLVADELLVDVQGSVGNPSLLPTDTNFFLRTNVNTLNGTIGGSASFDELNDINISNLRAGGFVSLRANGVDPTAGTNSGRAALRANLIDITGLDVAAPNGSVDVLFDTSKTIELGNATGLRTGRSLNSLAAGDVKIRSNAGSIVALDAPVAGGNARIARVATAAVLSNGIVQNGATMTLVAYDPGNPGFTPSTLQGRGDLNAWLGVQIQPLRAGDRVLVKDQASKEQNGVYSVSFISTPTWTPTTTWALKRAADSDTTAELPSNSFVSVGEPQSNINQVGTYQITANYIPLNGATTTVSVPVAAGSTSATLASAANIRAGMVVFGPGLAANTTLASVAGATVTLSKPTTAAIAGGTSLKFVNPAVTRQGTRGAGLGDVQITGLSATSDLRVGMLVVADGIPDDTVITRILNGTTVVISKSATTAGTGAINFITPFATRTATTSDTTVTNLSTTGDLIVGMVVVGPGIAPDTTIASIGTGTQLTLSRAVTAPQSGGALKFLAATPTNFGRAPITVVSKAVSTDIGSNNPNSKLTFVVSTNAGTNGAPGSLGKMISLRQQNVARLANDPAEAAGSQVMDFRFSAAVATNLTPIQLTQELPEITKAFTIDGTPTYPAIGVPGSATPPLIDGSRITTARNGRNLVAGDTASGLVVRGRASGTVIRNVNLGGFAREVTTNGVVTARSAAIDVQAAGVLVSNVTLGVSELNVRLANSVGVRFSGLGATSGTLLNSNVFGSNDSGLVVESNADRVSVVGTTFGKTGIENAIGATMTTGINQFGVDPVTPVRPIPQVMATRIATNRFTLPANWPSAARLVPGLEILGPTILPISGNTRATISAVATDATTGITAVTIAGGSISSVGLVTFIANDPLSIPEVLATKVDNMFTVPTAIATRLTVGMQASGPNIGLNLGSTRATITSITRSGDVTAVTVTGGTVIGSGNITFGTPPTPTFVLSVQKIHLTLAASSRAVGALLFSGLPLLGTTINPATPATPARVNTTFTNPTTGVTMVSIVGGAITSSGTVKFGDIVSTAINQRTITLPATVNMDNLFLGQSVTGIGIAVGTTITAIDRTTRTVAFAEDRKMTRSGLSAITFGNAGRNTVTQNRTGMVLAGGATTVTNNSIFANTFNGIDIRGSGWPTAAPTSHHRIGTTLAPTSGSNQIHSNGGWGVFYTSTITDDIKNNRVRIQGNYLGTTTLAIVSSTLSNRKGNMGHFVAGREAIFAGLGSSLVPRATDGLDPSNNQHGRYQGTSGGSGTSSGGPR